MTSQKSRSSGPGFALVEMLFVILIILVLVGLTISSFDKMRDNMAPRQAAMEFMSALRAAHQYSMDNSIRTRLVFADSQLPLSTNAVGFSPTNSYGVYAFYVPQQPMGGVQYNGNSVGNEFSLMPTLSIPSGFVGQWVPCPLQSKWRTISRRVQMKVIPDIFAQSVTNFYASNYYTPSQTWVPVGSGTNLYGSNTMNAVYPANYYQTPFPSAYALITTNMPPTETSYLTNSSGQGVQYTELWQTNINYRYFGGGSSGPNPNAPAVTEINGTPNRKFFDLPGVEFDTRGYPAFTTTNLITFVFTEKKNTNNYYEVVIDRAVGIPRMVGQ